MAVKKKKAKEVEQDTELLADLVKKTNDWYQSYNEHIERARNFLTFLYVDQWDLNIRAAREAMSRPTMTFNKLTTIVRSILGEARENSPALTVRGIGKDISQQIVDVKEGLLRQIHYDSDADIVYQIANKHGLEIGWGAARVITKYEKSNKPTFNQCLQVVAISDFQAAFFDPCAQDANKSDGDYCGVYTTMSLDHFKRYHPDIENPQSAPTVGTVGNNYILWSTRDTIVVAEIYYKEYFNKTIVELSDGNILELDKAKEILKMQEEMMASQPDLDLQGFQPLEIVNEREERDYKIKHCKYILNHILEKTDWAGKILPIVYFEGDSTVIDGERIPLPFIQDSIDTQKLINYQNSEMAGMMLRARKETVIGTPKNFAGYEDEWRNPDQVQGPLLYNNDPQTGKPEFINVKPFSEAYLAYYQNSTQDLKEITGQYDESRGNQSNAISGIAIGNRQEASKKPVNVYQDNWMRGIKQIGKICLEMIPHVYDNERTVMVRDKDGTSKAVTINQKKGFKMLPNGDVEQNIDNDMSYGEYDVEVSVDGSYDTQTAAAMDTLIKLATINPAIGNLIPDLIAQNSGLENTQQLVERLKTLLPPDILAKENGEPPPQQPPQPPPPEVIVAQTKMQIAQQDAQVKQKQMALEEQRLMLESEQSGVDRQVSFAKAQSEITKANTDRDIALLNHATKIKEAHVKLQTNKPQPQGDV